jgi:hypothetical protein
LVIEQSAGCDLAVTAMAELMGESRTDDEHPGCVDGRVCLAQQHHNRGAVVEVDAAETDPGIVATRGVFANERSHVVAVLPQLGEYARPMERQAARGSRHPSSRTQGSLSSGTVRWFKDEKGYGRITADDGEVLFVLFSVD